MCSLRLLQFCAVGSTFVLLTCLSNVPSNYLLLVFYPFDLRSSILLLVRDANFDKYSDVYMVKDVE
jgi:hypothetical protein